MLESIFYLQLIFFVALTIFAIYYKSPAVFCMAGVFGLITAIALASEGVEYSTGWEGSIITNGSSHDFNVSESYTTKTITDGSFLQAWYYAFLGTGFFLIAIGLTIGLYPIASTAIAKNKEGR